MNENSHRTTLTAGLFVLVGLVLLGALIFNFGGLRHRLREPYKIYANFLDAQNLIKGAPVKRAGATIGLVSTSPKLVDGLKGVQVTLDIYPEFQIPVGSPLRIASVGLIGDSLLEVGQPPQEMLTGEYIKPGSVIQGLGSIDLTATANRIADEIMVVVSDVRRSLTDLSKTLNKLNDGVLSEDNVRNFSGGLMELRESIHKIDFDVLGDGNIAQIKDALESFSGAMAKMNAASAKVDGIVTKADTTMKKIDSAMDSLGPTLKGTQSVTASLKDTSVAMQGLLKDARTGDGLLNALLNDPALRKDFTALISNLKQRGVLWYKDKEIPASPANEQQLGPRQKPFGAR